MYHLFTYTCTEECLYWLPANSDTKKNVESPFSFFVFQKDELRRKTKGYLPECDVAFIDEIFKVHDVVTDLWWERPISLAKMRKYYGPRPYQQTLGAYPTLS